MEKASKPKPETTGLRENIEETLQDICLSKDFLNKNAEAQAIDKNR